MDDILEFNHGNIREIDLTNEMKNSFLSYAMSVIVARALPDVRDGLKPVQRRILWGMKELNITPGTAFKKSARIVGEVMGKYHPHGDSSIYEAMARMAQDFSYRYPMVDGNGNFGSVDGDKPAAMRYTEARMSKITLEMLRDIDKDTVNFLDNYDATEREPEVLPSKFPQLLANGATGIAVGMATNIPPHNLGEIIDATVALLDHPELDNLGLMQYIKGPDFPTGGLVLGADELRKAYETGQGSVVVRAKADIVEEKSGKTSIIITEIPYQVNKKRLIERIAEVAKEKIVEGITDLRDETNRNGMRIVIELKKDINPHVMLNNLFKYTQLQTTFGYNMIALVKGQPKKLSLKEILENYIEHQFEVITRRTQFELRKNKDRLHILEGLLIALDNIDAIIKIIRETVDGTEKEKLINNFNLSEVQAQAILSMQLRSLSGLNRKKTEDEYEVVSSAVKECEDILASQERKHQIIKNELIEIKEKYNIKRLTEIDLKTSISIENEDLIPTENVIITITEKGYAKRMPVDNYKTQNRGGTGLSGIKTNENDVVEHSISSSTHDYLLFFTDKGRVYKIKGYDIPEGSRTSKGLPIVNVLQFEKDEKLAAVTNIHDFDSETDTLFFTTKKGIVKRTAIKDFKNIRPKGIIAITMHEDDELLAVKLTDGNKEIILGASNGKAIRFKETDVRVIGRSAAGVRGMDLGENEYLVGMAVAEKTTTDQTASDSTQILVVTEHGYGKRSHVSEYRLQSRGGKGVKTVNVTEKNGNLTTLKEVNDDDDLIITTNKGVVIRLVVSKISSMGRSTQGVKLIKLRDDQRVSTITIVPHEESEESELEENNIE